MTPAPARKGSQPRKLMLALVLLLVALVAILIKDRQFWFGSEEAVIESDLPTAQPTPASAAQSAPVATKAAPAASSAPAHATKNPVATAKTSSQPVAPEAPAVTATRTVLPPLDVEVIAGDNHHTVRPRSNVTKVQVAKVPGIQLEAPAASVTSKAATHEVVPASATHLPQTEIHATYPVLAQHMNVQGSVVLEALIGTDGMIENVRVLRGPAILSSAAQQAVREWKFKPIYQHGQAVESKATITVNFTIRVGDSLPSSTLAQGTPSLESELSR
ncbi:MAG: energy transducer TonB [Candidatus Sulfotelmatobacter sp.]